MSLTLTTLSSDNFNRSNQYPLGGLWELDEAGDQGLEVVGLLANVLLASPSNNTWGYEIYGYSLPNDQFASVTITSTFFDGVGAGYEGANVCPEIKIKVRVTDIGVSNANGPAYSLLFQYNGSNTSWQLIQETGTQIASGTIAAVIGGIFSIAVVGTTVYALYNGTVLTSVTNTSFSSGSAAMYFTNDVFGSSGGLVSLFAVGSASNSGGGGSDPAYDPTKPFIGAVRILQNPPSNVKVVPFIGTMINLGSTPPSKFPNPAYIGDYVAGTPVSNDTNPQLGQYVEITELPAGQEATFLGSVEGS